MNGIPACSCIDSYIGQPPNCRPECSINAECTSNKACINNKCNDPCPGSCGTFALCSVFNHVPMCTCIQGYTGDPFTQCTLQPSKYAVNFISKIRNFWIKKILLNDLVIISVFKKNFNILIYIVILVNSPTIIENKCDSLPCGPNADCSNGVCTCLPEFKGNPYIGCRPECVLNSDCPRDRACLQRKCLDPCPGACASNALCTVINHVPMCRCPTGMEGNAFVRCTTITSTYI